MIHLNPSRNMAARPRAGCFPGLFLLAGWLALVTPLRADNPPTFLFQIDASAVPGGFYPYAVALDSSNDVYVVDANDRVEKFDSNGNYLTRWGGSGTNNGQFNYPYGIAVDTSNNVYVTDSGNYRVEKFDSNGNYLTQWGSFGSVGSGNGQFNIPYGVAVDGSNNVYVSDEYNYLQKFTSSGTYLTRWGSLYLEGIAVDRSNNVYVTDIINNRVEKFDSNGNYLTQWGSYGTNNGQFNLPYGVAVDSNNNVYVTDFHNHRVEKFDRNGNYLTQWGSYGTNNGQFEYPVGIAVDRRGNFVYVADTGNARIQVFVNLGPPIITNQPASLTVPAGINVSVGVGVLGTAPFAYQWISNSVAAPGATNATFALTNVSPSASGPYSVLVTNNFGSQLSRNALLTVLPALVTTLPASVNSPTGAVLNGSVTVGPDETVAWFEWGPDANYGNIAGVTVVPAEANAVAVSTALSGLSTNYLYHYRLVAANDYGLAYGADQEFAVAVLNTNDSGPGSLRQAIEMASSGSSITFLVTGPITLTSGELLITNDLTITGPGAANLAISGNHTNRVFEIGSNAMVSISGLTIRDGHAADGAGYNINYSGLDGDGGGGIYNQGTLKLSHCALTDNSAGNGGAGGDGRLGNFLGGWGGAGGGVYNANTFQATACTFSGNQAGFGGVGGLDYGGWGPTRGGGGGDGGDGGGLYNLGTMTLTNCTLVANESGAGGVSGDGGFLAPDGGFGGSGGGIFNSGVLALVACTLSANSAGSGGDYSGFGGSGGGICSAATNPTAELLDTVVGSNRPGPGGISSYNPPGAAGAGPDLAGPFTSLGYNLIGQTNGCTGFTNGVNADLAGTTANPLDPQLGPLANNGGPTLTMALLHGSPALAAGDDALPGPPYHLTTDQRGFPRNTGAHVDIGAFQFQPIATPPALITLTGSAASGFQLAFTNTSSATFSVLTATNLSLPSSDWTVLGQALELAAGQFQFTDPQTTNAPQRFYRVSSP